MLENIISKINSFKDKYILCRITVKTEVIISETIIEIKKVLLFTLFKNIGTLKMVKKVIPM